MNMMSSADVEAFVEARFGEKKAEKLGHIGTGGENNKKGSDFESSYAVHTVCSIGAAVTPAECENYRISCQEAAFVDDLCVRNVTTGHKVNYQAKNSDGSAANWDADMQNRFDMQAVIDEHHHKAATWEQVLVVSSEAKAAANDAKIPDGMRAYCRSEYFPYEHSSTALVMEHVPLRQALTTLCGSPNLSLMDAAFRLVLGQWCADNRNGRTVLDVLTKAKASSHPDIFGGFHPPEVQQMVAANDDSDSPPRWLTDLLDRFQMGPVTVECTAFKVSYNGMEVKVAVNAAAPEPSKLSEPRSPGEVLMLLMTVEAGMLADRQPTGGDQQ
ncbi:hypothetical protein QM325_04075 [Pseudomonas putida]|nr:hypothetical protein [Pseudomonas putida]